MKGRGPISHRAPFERKGVLRTHDSKVALVRSGTHRERPIRFGGGPEVSYSSMPAFAATRLNVSRFFARNTS
jgi:hypothetical protein